MECSNLGSFEQKIPGAQNRAQKDRRCKSVSQMCMKFTEYALVKYKKAVLPKHNMKKQGLLFSEDFLHLLKKNPKKFKWKTVGQFYRFKKKKKV